MAEAGSGITGEYADPLTRIPSLADLNVGPEKPLGYLVVERIKTLGGDPEMIRREAERKGQLVKSFRIEDGSLNGPGDTLFVADKDALARLLSLNASILLEAGWPTEPETFVDFVATHAAPFKTKLYDIIADAFGDKSNPKRTDVTKI